MKTIDFAAIKTSVENAARELEAGHFILVADDSDRENEADLVIAADRVTPEAIAFMVRYTTGILTVPMLAERLQELQLEQMVVRNTETHRTAFTVSVDYKHGTTTGVSAHDRCKTIRALVDPDAKPGDFARPGHMFPLRYREGGVLKRAGHTEASIDLCRLAGVYPAAVISELVNEDGSTNRSGSWKQFSIDHNISVLYIADLVRYRRRYECLIQQVSSARIPTDYGVFTSYVYHSVLDGVDHIAFVKGDITGNTNGVLVRVHSECLTGDIFRSRRCDCGEQLQLALQMIAKEGAGVVVYLRGHEGRGIGLGHKVSAYHLQDSGRDTVEANLDLGLPIDSREYGLGAQILADLGVKKMRLLTNNPAKYHGLEGYDLEIVSRVPLVTDIHRDNIIYLRTKREKLGHILSIPEDDLQATSHT